MLTYTKFILFLMRGENHPMSHNNQKKIAVINDFSGFGRCSIAVALPIISAMKIQCCPIPTAIFSNHTGFQSFYYKDYTQSMKPYIAEWKKLGLQFEGIDTGFLGSEEQIEIVIDFFQQFKSSDTIGIVDPVMGDNGKLYPTYSPKLASKMHWLVEYADILTPNLTEACILTGKGYRENYSMPELEKMCHLLSQQGPKKIVISGIQDGEYIGNFVYEQGKESKIIHSLKIGATRSGTGDVFSSIIAGAAVNGIDFYQSVQLATDFISKSVLKTTEMGIPDTDGICFEEFLTDLIV